MTIVLPQLERTAGETLRERKWKEAVNTAINTLSKGSVDVGEPGNIPPFIWDGTTLRITQDSGAVPTFAYLTDIPSIPPPVIELVIGNLVTDGIADAVLYIDNSGNLACTSKFIYSAAATEIQLSNDWANFGGTPVSAGLSLTNTSAGAVDNLTRGLTFNFNNNAGAVWEFANIHAGSTYIGAGAENGKLVFQVRKSGTVADALNIDASTSAFHFGTGYDFAYDGTTLKIGDPDASGISNAYIGAAWDSYARLGLFHADYNNGWSWASDPVEVDLRLKSHVSSASGTDCLVATVGGNFNLTGTLSVGTTAMASGCVLEIIPGSAALMGANIRGGIAALYNPLQITNAAASSYFLVVSPTGKVGLNTASPAQMLHLNIGHIRMDQIARPSSALTATVGAAGVLTGAYYYTVTYVAPSGETQYSSLSTVCVATADTIELTNIPVSPDATVTARKIYRNAAANNSQKLQLVTTINNNTATTYSDNNDDSTLGVGFGGNTTGGSIYIGSTRTMIFDNNCFSIGQSTGIKGFANTWVGHGCGASITLGYENVAIGSSAGGGLTSATACMLLGYSAGSLLTTGSNNVAIGRASLRYCTTNANNMALGTNAGFYALGANNVLVGTSAGFGVSTTSTYSNVTAIGLNAGYSLTTGDNNCLIGGYSGRYIVDGVANCCFGYNCGDNITSGNYNILLGYSIDAQSATGSNQISIGNLIFGTGTNTGTTVSTGDVGIGTATPGAKLDAVAGAVRSTRSGYLNAQYTEITTGDGSNCSLRYMSAGGNQKNARIDFILDSGVAGASNALYFRNGVVGAEVTRMCILYDGKVGINTISGIGQLTIERNNTDFTNTAGAGTHLLLTNANASGITGIMALINGANSFKIRGDSSGNLTWVSYANAANLGHFFYVNGDFGTGSCWMMVANKGVVIGSAAASTSSQAWLTLTLGGSGANQAPLKFQDSSGTVLATPEAGAVEFSSNRLYITNSTPARKTIAYTDDAMPGTVPVGGVIAWLKSYTNTPALSSWFVEANGQTLSDAASVYNGQVIPNLNGSSSTQRFLRGSTTSGTTGGSDSHTHSFTTGTESALANADTNGDGSQASFASGCHTHTGTTDSTSTLPSYYEVVWVMRVK